MNKDNSLIEKIGIDLLGNSDTTLGSLIKNIPNGNLTEFTTLLGLWGDIAEYIENFKQLNICMTIALNIIPYQMYSSGFIGIIFSEFAEKVQIKKGCEKDFEKSFRKIEQYAKEHKETFNYFMNHEQKKFNEIADIHSDSDYMVV